MVVKRKQFRRTSYTQKALKRGASKSRVKVADGGNRMIPYYYRKKYGKKK